jgi:hypothetical protein
MLNMGIERVTDDKQELLNFFLMEQPKPWYRLTPCARCGDTDWVLVTDDSVSYIRVFDEWLRVSVVCRCANCDHVAAWPVVNIMEPIVNERRNAD